MRYKKITKRVLCIFLLCLLLSIVPFAFSYATGLTNWPDTTHTYFNNDNQDNSGGVFVLTDTVTDGYSDAVPVGVNTTAELVAWIKALYNREKLDANNTEAKKNHNQIGAAFIIQTMRSNGTTYDRDMPSAEDVAEWENIVLNYKAENIQWNATNAQAGISASSKNTYYKTYSGNSKGDIGWHYSAGSQSPRGSIVFRDDSGNIRYIIKRNCANPIGNLFGLMTWSAEPGVGLYVNGTLQYRLDSKSGDKSTNVNVGDRVGWRNIVEFSNGSSSVQYSAEKGGSWAGSIYGGITTTNVDRALLSEELGGKDKLIEASDVGKTFCLWTHIDPSSQGGSSAASSKACVYVKPNWNISAISIADKTVAAPGDRIIWTHNLKNDGPSNTTDRIYSRLGINGIPGWNGSDMAGAYTEGGQDIGIIRNITDYSIYDVLQRDVGNTLCEQIQYQRMDDLSSGAGNNACVEIPYSYTLTPIVSINPGNVIEDGSSFTVTPTIKNDGATKSKPSNWSLVELITYPSGAVKSTTTVGSGNNITFDQNSTKTVVTLTPTASGEAGTKYCYILSASPRSGDDDSVVSAQACITIGKKPKVQITGGNLSAGGLVNTSTSIKNSRMFGSWTEYGVFAVGSISGMASGSAFASATGLAGYSVCNYSTLSFTNVKTGASTCSGNTGTIGNYVGANTTTSVASSFPGGNTINDSSVSANSLMSGKGIYIGNKTGDLTLSSSTLSASKSVILKVSGTVTITGDQFYENKTYTNAAELPQLIIIANNINIADNVANIDAWLIANNGNINTCSNFSGNLTINKCAQKLTINGPISAKKLLLYRTAGSGTGVNSGDPAEVFNLRADTYLWSAAYAKMNNKIQSVYTTELPPRF